MYSFNQSADCNCLDEPLYAHYLHRHPEMYRPYREDLCQTEVVDGNEVVKTFYHHVDEAPIVVAKHMSKVQGDA